MMTLLDLKDLSSKKFLKINFKFPKSSKFLSKNLFQNKSRTYRSNLNNLLFLDAKKKKWLERKKKNQLKNKKNHLKLNTLMFLELKSSEITSITNLTENHHQAKNNCWFIMLFAQIAKMTLESLVWDTSVFSVIALIFAVNANQKSNMNILYLKSRNPFKP